MAVDAEKGSSMVIGMGGKKLLSQEAERGWLVWPAVGSS